MVVAAVQDLAAASGPPARGGRGSARTSPAGRGRRAAPARCAARAPGATSPTGRCSRSGSVPPAGQQPQEVRLARAVRAEHRDPLAVPDLHVERPHQPGQLEPLADHGALAGAPAAQAHPDPLLAGLLGGRAGLLELAQAGLRRLVAAGHGVVVRGLLLVHRHQVPQLGVLLVPAPTQLVQPCEAVLARLVVRREPARVRPHLVARRAELDGDHAGRGVGQQLAVVRDEQDRLGRLADPLLQPGLARHVEVVVRLVEQQHLVRAAQQVLQGEALLLAAAQRAQRPVPRPLERHAHRRGGAHVPDHLEVVPAGLGVLGERRRVAQLGGLVLGLHERQLELVDRGLGGPDALGGEGEQQVGHGLVVAAVAHELAHGAQRRRSGSPRPRAVRPHR